MQSRGGRAAGGKGKGRGRGGKGGQQKGRDDQQARDGYDPHQSLDVPGAVQLHNQALLRLLQHAHEHDRNTQFLFQLEGPGLAELCKLLSASATKWQQQRADNATGSPSSGTFVNVIGAIMAQHIHNWLTHGNHSRKQDGVPKDANSKKLDEAAKIFKDAIVEKEDPIQTTFLTLRSLRKRFEPPTNSMAPHFCI